jgi:gluconolactonase
MHVCNWRHDDRKQNDRSQRLGIIRLPQQPANMAWGDKDGKSLYITARTGIYRMRLNIAGIRPGGR